jgi:anti-sigma factor RsiW
MASYNRKRSAAPPPVNDPGWEKAGPLDEAVPPRPRLLERRIRGRRRRRPPVKSFWSWILSVMFLGLIGLLLGIMLGGLISA